MTLFETICNVVGQALLGWLLADFMSGFFHWWEDRVGREDMPFIGPQIVRPNRLHHVEPLAFTYNTLLHRNAPLWIIAALISALWLALGGRSTATPTGRNSPARSCACSRRPAPSSRPSTTPATTARPVCLTPSASMVNSHGVNESPRRAE
jgi:hypothetical protein